MKEQNIDLLLQKIEKKEKQKRYWMLAIIGSTLSIALASILFLSNKAQESIVIAEENQILKDSTKTLVNFKDSLALINRKRNVVEKRVLDYYQFDEQRKLDSLSFLLADTLNRFYLDEGLVRKEVLERIKWHWEQYPESSTKLKEEPEVIIQGNTTKVFLFVEYQRRKTSNIYEYLAELQFNESGKIVSIRNYEASHDIYQEKLSQ